MRRGSLGRRAIFYCGVPKINQAVISLPAITTLPVPVEQTDKLGAPGTPAWPVGSAAAGRGGRYARAAGRPFGGVGWGMFGSLPAPLGSGSTPTCPPHCDMTAGKQSVRETRHLRCLGVLVASYQSRLRTSPYLTLGAAAIFEEHIVQGPAFCLTVNSSDMNNRPEF